MKHPTGGEDIGHTIASLIIRITAGEGGRARVVRLAASVIITSVLTVIAMSFVLTVDVVLSSILAMLMIMLMSVILMILGIVLLSVALASSVGTAIGPHSVVRLFVCAWVLVCVVLYGGGV